MNKKFGVFFRSLIWRRYDAFFCVRFIGLNVLYYKFSSEVATDWKNKKRTFV